MARTGMRLTHLKKLPRRNSLPARQNWSRWKSGGRMRRVLARRTAWWAKQGTRPVAAKDQRTKSAWIFGAICPARGGRACPAAVQYLRDARAPGRDIVTAGSHAVIILDKAGWHTTGKLDSPDNITLLPLPPRSPAPVENVWQYLRQNWLSNRVFQDQIVSLCCDAWNNLTERPWKIMSIGYRKWAHGF